MKLIPVKLTKTAGRAILHAKKTSPNLMFVAGTVGVVGGTILACKATLKLEDTLSEIKEEINEVKHIRDTPSLYPEAEYGKDMAYVYVKGTLKLVRLYAPSFIVGASALGLLTGSHVTLTKRNAGLTAAYAAVAKSYEEYRHRVRKEVGDEKELDLYHAVETHTFDSLGLVSDDPKAVLNAADPNRWSPYARFFDQGNRNWVKNAEYNRLFIQCQQNYANDLLQARGHIFLNEVYDMLGIDHSSAGSVVGWVISKTGDNFVDFGIFEASNADFVNGWEKCILLDFNVDGVIYDKI